MTVVDRRIVLAGLAATALSPRLAFAQPALSMLTAAQGSAFLPYGQGVGKVLEAKKVATLNVKDSKGSTENLTTVEADPTVLGLAFLGSAYQAVKGIAPFEGKPHTNVRALFPTYDTSFQVAAKKSTGLTTIKQLDGKKVHVGPAGGPAEGYFKGLVAELGINPTIVTGSTTDGSKAFLAGEIDAFWQGASIPIPAFVTLNKEADITIFGLNDAEVAAMLKRFPFLSKGVTAAGTYEKQTAPIQSVSAWNVVIAHKALPDDLAYAITKAVLDSTDLTTVIGPAAAPTKAENAPVNTVLPYHPGAARYLKERGVTVSSS